MKLCAVIRANGVSLDLVPFNSIKKGDWFTAGGYLRQCGEKPHLSGDATFDGYLLFDTEGNVWFPEDVERDVDI